MPRVDGSYWCRGNHCAYGATYEIDKSKAPRKELGMKQSKHSRTSILGWAMMTGLWVFACGGNSNNGGGTTSAGGDAGVSGSGATSGSINTGGSKSGGGAPSAGGSNASGGSAPKGGSSSTGGSTATAGAAATGGAPTVGGSTSTGGTSIVGLGGSTALGGTSNAGGVSNAAGMSTTGGISTAGGMSTAGGTAATGGSSGSCGADGSACTLTAGGLGLCQNGACAACSGSQGNTACSTAYGAGAGYVCAQGACLPGNCVTTADCTAGSICGIVTANVCGTCTNDGQCQAGSAYGAGHLCVSGSCVTGNCKVDTDCSTGQICGLQTPNTCSGCSADGQCQSDPTYGSGTICNTTSSTCVAAACTANSSACSANISDFCCSGTCTAGNCCTTADCQSLGNNYTCTNHTCTLCPQATGNTYYVDPVNGHDTTGTGSNSSAGCAFKTVTRALAFIGATPNSGTVVNILPTGSVSSTTGEVFPIHVPTNTTISGSGATATVEVPAASTGFVLSQASSGLTLLAIDGQTNTANYGIQVTGGTVTLSNLSVANMLHDGIHVINAASVSIGAGVSSTQNGTATTGADGLHVSNTSTVTINVTSGTATHFDNNSAHGIYVNGTASIALTATPGTNGTGTATTNNNTAAGVWIQQTPGATLPVNTISGLVAWANQGNGIRIVAGSAAQLRNSIVLANAANGVIVSTNTAVTPNSDDTSKIDLGTTTGPSYGKNTLQASLGSNPNGNAGICLQLTRTAGSVLNAAGNIFSGPVDCSTSTATLKHGNTCAGRVDVAVSAAGTTTNSIVVSQCN